MDPLRLLQDLSRPEAYPHPVREVRAAQTHASCVFLTGELAYKVKKPVDFGFLDYSALEQRRECCVRELRLNARLCPDVYLDVVPILERGGRLVIGPGERAGEAVEWAVRMRQLPEAEMLPARLAADTLTGEESERIARRLAAFHARSETSPEISAFGAPEVVAGNVEENFRQTEGRTGAALPMAHLEAVREYSRTFLRERADLFRRRIAAGRVRDGHGDLRAQNICLAPGLDGGVQIFDCIEFNDRFRYEDVAADLAYLAMDLDLAARADLRRVLLRAYTEASGDRDLAGVLPFYLCYRAYVRGKIALLAAEEAEIPAPDRAAHLETAAAAFDLARSYAAGTRSPLLVAMSGYSGSGKSRVARAIARRLPAVLLRSDRLRKELAGVRPEERLPAEWYSPERVTQVYREMRERAGVLLAGKEDVVLDATFLEPGEQHAAEALAREAGAGFLLVRCEAPDAVIRRRLAERAGDVSDADLAVYEAQVRRFGAAQPTGAGALTVDTRRNAGANARSVLERVWDAVGARGPVGRE